MSSPNRASAQEAIENLIFIYAERIDAGDFAGIGDLFAKARMLGPTGEVLATGGDEIRSLYEHSTIRYEDGSSMTQHPTSNVILELGGDGLSARARSRFSVMQALPDFPLQCIITGYYEDRFAYDDSQGWPFVERWMKPKLIGDLSRHLKYEIPNT